MKSVSGIFPCGQISIIMGASVAGKTTLLNLLASRMSQTGTYKLYANYEEYPHKKLGDFANYIIQKDVLMQTHS